jgi:hypothetical protein
MITPSTKVLFLFCLLIMAQPLFSQPGNDYKVASIGFYNLENLFDTIDSPTTNDVDFLPQGRLNWNTEKYLSKLNNMSKVISQLGTELSPDGVVLLGVAEIENRKVLEDLSAQPDLADRKYQIIHYDSPDERGVDVALLFQPKYFQLLGSMAAPVSLKDPKTGVVDYTRDILVCSMENPFILWWATGHPAGEAKQGPDGCVRPRLRFVSTCRTVLKHRILMPKLSSWAI